MKALSRLGRIGITLAAVAAALFVGWRLWTYYMVEPWTRDGRVTADILGVTPDVSGLISQVYVHDNQPVRIGEVLFRIDQARYELAVRQAQAVVASRFAAFQEAGRENDRYQSLSNVAVSQEKQQQTGATLAQASAAFQQSQADLGVARLNLERTDVKATVNGIVSNFDLRPGDYVTAGRAVFAMVDTDSLRVDGYFEETKLGAIHPGDPATISLLGGEPKLYGHVQSIAGGITDRERASGPDLLANVTPTFAWVRLAQRVPVRVKLEQVPAGVSLIPGRTATVVIHPAAH